MIDSPWEAFLYAVAITAGLGTGGFICFLFLAAVTAIRNFMEIEVEVRKRIRGLKS